MKHAIASPHWAATRAGERVFAAGGGAIDAAVAAALTLSVVYPQDCSIGGDMIALVRSPEGVFTLVNGSGPAPAELPAAVARAGCATMPLTGPLSVSVPGAVSGLGLLHERLGRRPWGSLFSDAIEYAAAGIELSPTTARFLHEDWAELSADPGFATVFGSNGDPLPLRALLQQPALAQTLAELAELGPEAFSTGSIASRFCAGLQAAGAPFSPADLSTFSAVTSTPISLRWNELEVTTSGPNTQGAVLLMLLAAIQHEGLDPDPLGPDAGRMIELAARVSELRDEVLGDGVELAGSLLDATDPEAISQICTEDRGRIPVRQKRLGGDTIAVVATDADGWAVSLILSVYEPFGARLLEPSTGIICHNRANAFSLEPGHPNLIAPGKRPMHTLMPVIVEREGECYSVQGTMGGKAQPQVHLSWLGRLASGYSPADAAAAPRWVVGGREATGGRVVQAEEGASQELDGLEVAGFSVQHLPPHHDAVGHLQAIVHTAGETVAVSDPRSDGSVWVG